MASATAFLCLAATAARVAAARSSLFPSLSRSRSHVSLNAAWFTVSFRRLSQSASCETAAEKSSVRLLMKLSASSIVVATARDGSSSTADVSFVSASSAPLNCPQRSTRVSNSRSSRASASHSRPAVSISSNVRGRSSRVCALSFSNSSMARSAPRAARSAASDARTTARNAGARTNTIAAPHVESAATVTRPSVATSGQPPSVTVTPAGGAALAVRCVFVAAATSAKGTGAAPARGETYVRPEISSGSAARGASARRVPRGNARALRATSATSGRLGRHPLAISFPGRVAGTFREATAAARGAVDARETRATATPGRCAAATLRIAPRAT